MVGYAVKGARINVVLSDGRTLTEADPELERVERNSVTVRGVKYWLESPKDRRIDKDGAVRSPPTHVAEFGAARATGEKLDGHSLGNE